MRRKITNETWEQIKTGYAAGINLREIARKLSIPEGTVLAHAKRQRLGLTQTEILKDVCQRNVDSEALNSILKALEQSGVARHEIEPTSTKPCTRWFYRLRRYDLYDLSRSGQSNKSYKSLVPAPENGDVDQAVSLQNGESVIEEAKHLFKATPAA